MSNQRTVPWVRGDILEGRNETSGLKAGTRAGLYAREHFRRQCHRDLFLVHDGLVPWIVEGAAHGVPGQAGAIEQQVNYS